MNRDKLYAELRWDEGLRYQVYDDANGQAIKAGSQVHGHPTIGIGRNLESLGLSDDEIKLMADNDIVRVERELDAAVPWWRDMEDQRQRALANMCFNLGWPRLSGFRKMLAALEAKDYATAAVEALDSKWARQVGARAERIATMFDPACEG